MLRSDLANIVVKGEQVISQIDVDPSISQLKLYLDGGKMLCFGNDLSNIKFFSLII